MNATRPLISGRTLLLPPVYRLKFSHDIEYEESGKNITQWGWSPLEKVIECVNDAYRAFGVPEIEPRDHLPIFENYGLLNRQFQGKPQVTWMSDQSYQIYGDPPKEWMSNIHIPSGWMTQIAAALDLGIVKVTSRQSTITRVFVGDKPFIFYALVADRHDGKEYELQGNGTFIRLYPIQKAS